MNFREIQEQYLQQEHEVTEERLVRGALVLTVLAEEDGLTFITEELHSQNELLLLGLTKHGICVMVLFWLIPT